MKGITRNIEIAFLAVVCLWVIYAIGLVLNTVSSVDIRSYGIQPREISGLAGIIFWPFLHGGLFHLLANSLALFFLLLLILIFYKKLTIPAVIIITLAGGAGVWLAASSNTVHIGASGVIFGLIGFLISGGIFRRELKSLFLSVIVLVIYGSLLLTLLVAVPGVSWTGHLFGFLAGVLAAWILRNSWQTG
jgi:membrane associated rhomboid family serine protease